MIELFKTALNDLDIAYLKVIVFGLAIIIGLYRILPVEHGTDLDPRL